MNGLNAAACASILCATMAGVASCDGDRDTKPGTEAARSESSFSFIGDGTTMDQVVRSLGTPDRDIGSGIHIYVYRLADGSEVWIGSADGSEILYVRRGSSTLYAKGPE